MSNERALVFHALDLAALPALGYRQLALTPLEDLCEQLGHHVPDLVPESWVALGAST